MNSTRLHTSIHEIDQKTWDSLNPNAYPGLLHGFLSALEDSNSVGEGTGWNPLYVTANDSNGLAAAMACFIKSDSYGEYVFDWAWADAYQKHGLSYYPKCITAIPFTPATGPSWANPSVGRAAIAAAPTRGLSSFMYPFPY